jgi:hypothetical protein
MPRRRGQTPAEDIIMDTKVIATLIDGSKVRGRLSTDHAASSYSQPVFVDDAGQAYNWTAIREVSTAREMGSRTSERKAAAARENGRKGGRPRKQSSYYVRIDTLWANSPDRWVGPFTTQAEAKSEIIRALAAADSLCCLASERASYVRNAVRILGVVAQSQAQRRGLHDWPFGDESSNVIGVQIPLDAGELHDIEEALAERTA